MKRNQVNDLFKIPSPKRANRSAVITDTYTPHHNVQNRLARAEAQGMEHARNGYALSFMLKKKNKEGVSQEEIDKYLSGYLCASEGPGEQAIRKLCNVYGHKSTETLRKIWDEVANYAKQGKSFSDLREMAQNKYRAGIAQELCQMSFMANHTGFLDEKAYIEVANVVGADHNSSRILLSKEKLEFLYGYDEEQMEAYQEGYRTGYPDAPYLLSIELEEQEQPQVEEQRQLQAKENFVRDWDFVPQCGTRTNKP